MRGDDRKARVIACPQPLRCRPLVLVMALGAAALPAMARGYAPAAPAPQRTEPSASDARLAWRAFMAAGDLDDAMALATNMLRTHPHSVLWHQRLASAAEQNGKSVIAARAYAWLSTRGQQYHLLPKAIDLAVATQQNDIAVRLLQARSAHEPFDAAHWRQLIGTLLNVGRLQHTLTLLRQADRAHPRAFFLQHEADVLAEMGQPARQADVLRRKIRRYGADASTSLQLATLEYVHGHMHRALATLKQALATAPARATAYWQTLGALAWTLQDLPASARASAALVRAGTAQATDYQRLYLLHIGTDPGVAYAYAWIGWRHTRTVALFFDALAAAEALHADALAGAVFASVHDRDRKLAAYTEYWTRWAQLAHAQGHNALARSRYRRALQRSPHDADVIAGYLWLLVDTRDLRTLSLLADRWGATHPRDAGVREALAAGLALLGRPGRALAMLQPYRSRHQDDATWLLQYAGLLDQADRADAARAADLKAARALSRSASPATGSSGAAQRRGNTIDLQQRLTPGDPARSAIAGLLAHPARGATADAVLAWTLAQDSPEASALWLRRHYTRTAAPGWARLNQSLATDDATATMRLLNTDAGTLPRRDRVSAADTLGWHALAASLAYRGLEGEPRDRDLQRQFQNLAVPGSDAVGGTLDWLRSGGLESLQATATTRHWLSHDWSLRLRASTRRQLRIDSAQLAVPPPTARDAQLTLTQRLPRGERGIIVGGGRNTASYTHLGIFQRYRVSRRLQLELTADLGAAADDSVPLSIGGVADRIDVGADWQWTAWDSLGATADIARLRAQGGGHLGARQRLQLDYRHQLWLAPPQVTAVASASGARYRHAGDVPDSVRRLIPVGQPADTRLFVPRSYAQTCVGAGLNEGLRDTWTPRMHLFGTASACLNSVSGVGPEIAGGLSTPVLGPDHLNISLGYSNNAGASGNRSFHATLTYRYHFTP